MAPAVPSWQGITAVAAEPLLARWILPLAFALLVSEAQACRCEQLSLADAFRQADVVAEVEIRQVDRPGRGQPVHATVRVISTIKNAAGLRGLATAPDSAQCGLTLEAGQRYWIFGDLQPGSTTALVDACDGTRAVDQPFDDAPVAEVREAMRTLGAGLGSPSPSPLEIAARVTVDTEWPADTPLTGAVYSPNGAYAYVLIRPTAIQRPPRVARLIVNRERETRLALSLHGVVDSADAQWINEKLILVQVDWSPALRSDLVLDVEAGALLAVETWAAPVPKPNTPTETSPE